MAFNYPNKPPGWQPQGAPANQIPNPQQGAQQQFVPPGGIQQPPGFTVLQAPTASQVQADRQSVQDMLSGASSADWNRLLKDRLAFGSIRATAFARSNYNQLGSDLNTIQTLTAPNIGPLDATQKQTLEDAVFRTTGKRKDNLTPQEAKTATDRLKKLAEDYNKARTQERTAQQEAILRKQQIANATRQAQAGVGGWFNRTRNGVQNIIGRVTSLDSPGTALLVWFLLYILILPVKTKDGTIINRFGLSLLALSGNAMLPAYNASTSSSGSGGSGGGTGHIVNIPPTANDSTYSSNPMLHLPAKTPQLSYIGQDGSAIDLTGRPVNAISQPTSQAPTMSYADFMSNDSGID